MKWLNRFKESLDYIEDNLRDDIDHNIVAEKACLSRFYYYRMFQIVTGMTLGEYIRNRRMTLAAKDLKNSDLRIIDIALDYGYGSQEAFSRAFKSVHGISPSQAKKPNSSIKAFPTISFQLQLKGDVEMDYRIEQKEAIQLVSISKKIPKKDEENFRIIPEFWQETTKKGGIFELLLELTDNPEYSYGVSANFDSNENAFDYYIGVEGNNKESNFEAFIIPENTYAVFGPVEIKDLQNLWKRIFSEWLPATDYEIGNGPQIEYYITNKDNNLCTVASEVWIPVKK